MRYWQPLLAKTTATCSLRHPENERQMSVNSLKTCIFRNQGIARQPLLAKTTATPSSDVPQGAAVLLLLVSGVAVGQFTDCRCVADVVEVTL